MSNEINTISEAVLPELSTVGTKRAFIETALHQAEQRLTPELREKIIRAPIKTKKTLIDILEQLNKSVLNPEGIGVDTIISVLHAITHVDVFYDKAALISFANCFNELHDKRLLNQTILEIFLKKEVSFNDYRLSFFNQRTTENIFLNIAIRANDINAVKYLIETCHASLDHFTASFVIDHLDSDNPISDYLLSSLLDATPFFENFRTTSNEKVALWFEKIIGKVGFYESDYRACLRGSESAGVRAKKIKVFFSSNPALAAAVVRSVFPDETSTWASLSASGTNQAVSFEFKLFVFECAKQLDWKACKAALTWLAQDRENFNYEIKKNLVQDVNYHNIAPEILPWLIQLPCQEEEDYLKHVFQFEAPSKQTASQNTLPSDDPYSPVFNSIRELLSNPTQFLSFLDPLETALAKACDERNLALAPLERAGTIVIPQKNGDDGVDYFSYCLSIEDAIPWPVFRSSAGKKTASLLNDLLLQEERKHGINTDPSAPAYFFKFVPAEIANQFIAEGNLFNECNHVGNLLHGKYSHRLQWYVILKAIDEKYIILPPGCSVIDIFKQLPKRWTGLLDTYSHGFYAPHYLHAYLLSPQAEKRFPFLCSYLQKTHSNSIEKVCQRDPEATAENVTLRYHLYGRFFASNFTPPESAAEIYGEEKIRYRSNSHQQIFFKNRALTFDNETEKTQSLRPAPSSSSC